MRKGIVILLIIAASLIVIGGAAFTVGFVMMDDGSFAYLNNNYQEKIYESSDKINSITIKTDTADVEILPYDSEGYKVECFDKKNLSHAVSVEEGSLCIEKVDSRAWYEYISLFSQPTKITVYIPAGEYSSLSLTASTGSSTISKDFIFDKATVTASTGNVTFYATTKSTLNVSVSTGDIKLESSSHGDICLKASTGDTALRNLTCKNVKTEESTGKTTINGLICNDFTSTGNTGDLSMTSVISSGTVTINRSSGHVKFDKCDAAELKITTDTGDVTGTLLSSKVFIYNTDTGDVSLPETITGGICKITTDTGDIKISIVE